VADPSQTQQVLGKYIQVTDPAIVRTALDELSATLPQAASADPATFIDTSFTDQLESSGWIRELYP
jgi:hypothetical protein